MFFFQEGFTYRNFLHGRPHDIRLHHVVLAANFGCRRPISTPRYFGLGQGNLGSSPDTGSVYRRLCIFDFARKEHGGAQHAAGSAGA